MSFQNPLSPFSNRPQDPNANTSPKGRAPTRSSHRDARDAVIISPFSPSISHSDLNHAVAGDDRNVGPTRINGRIPSPLTMDVRPAWKSQYRSIDRPVVVLRNHSMDGTFLLGNLPWRPLFSLRLACFGAVRWCDAGVARCHGTGGGQAVVNHQYFHATYTPRVPDCRVTVA